MLRYKRVSFTIALLLLVYFFPSSGKADNPYDLKFFEFSAFYGYDDKGKVYLDLGISIAYQRLVFFKQPDGYRAEYRVYTQIFDSESGKIVEGDVWEGVVTSEDYRETRSSEGASSINKRIYLQPGKYNVEGMIEVIGTNIEYKRKTVVEIPGGVENVPNLSEPIFSIPEVERKGEKPPLGEVRISMCMSPVTSGFKMCPNGIYADFDMWLRASFNLSIHSSSEKKGKCYVSVKISDFGNKVVSYNKQQVLLDETGHSIFCLDFNVDDYRMGVYRMAISAEIEGTKKIDLVRKKFVIIFNKASLYEHFGETRDLISLVASEAELAPLVKASPERRIDEWNAFWSGRESARGGGYYNFEEFIGNMSFVLRHFSDGLVGWKTEMGRIFIKNGKPDKVVTKQGDEFGVYYQFWYYYSRGIIYIFADKFGTGDYRYVRTRHF
ncbi:GWxTD domain-containing protein [bacterium]|nr:GWxTD domain-containing protein [bacterium]